MISETTVDQIAALARIAVPTDQRDVLRQQLNDILAMVSQLQNIDTTGIEPLPHPLEPTDIRWRQDQAKQPTIGQIEAVKHEAPAISDGHFVVPAVISDDSHA